MGDYKTKISKIKKAQLLLLIPLGLSLIAGIALAAVKDQKFYVIPVFLIVGIGIAELVLAVVRSTINNKNKPQPIRTYAYSEPKRAVSDNLIKEFDDYISKEMPELPLDNASIGINYTEDYLPDLRKAGFEMQKHLGISSFIITITLKKLGSLTQDKVDVGHFRMTGNITAEIEIDSSLNATMSLACLAHEMAHAYQIIKGKIPYNEGTIKEEQFTDLLTYYLGFSKIVRNGYYYGNHKLGYVEAADFAKIEEIYSSRTSSKGSFKKEKHDLIELINLYKTMVEQILELCEQLSHKYMPSDDKEFINKMTAKYDSQEVKDYINKVSDNIERKAKLDIEMDQIGVEMKIEELLEDKIKVQRIHDYIFGN